VLELLAERDATMSGAVPRMDKTQKEMERAEEEKNKLLEKKNSGGPGCGTGADLDGLELGEQLEEGFREGENREG
jgi:hypothetical protein